MLIKRVLLLAPLLLVTVLLQSYFWVPSYEKQTTGNPERVTKFITATSGDARLLNPILSADSASSYVVGAVFDTLLDLDENLALKPNLAKSWEITSLVTVATRADRHPTAASLRAALESALPPDVRGIEVLPPEVRSHEIDPDGPGDEPPVPVSLRLPERLRIHLPAVDLDLVDTFRALLGEGYVASYPREAAVAFDGDLDAELAARLRPRAEALVPVILVQPVIDFALRDDVRFHDGEPFDASDVKFTYEAIMNPRNLSPRTSDFEPIERLEVQGPHEVRIVYKRPFSPAINAWSYMGMLPEHLLNEAALEREMDERGLSGTARERFGIRDSRFNRAPVGTGAFRFVFWRSDEVIHLRRNDDYFDRVPEYREVYVRVIPDLVTQELEFRAGAVDQYGAQPHQAARYANDDTYQSFSSVSFGYTYIGYNNRRPPFDDPRVRRALGMAINVEQIIEYVLYGEGARITGPYPVQTDWYDRGIAPLPFDLEGAETLLGEAGYRRNAEGWLEKDGRILGFNLISNNGNPQRKAILTIAQNAWQKLGVRVETRLFEWAVFLKDFVNTGEFDAVVLGWGLSPVDADLYQIWHSSQSGPQQLNFVGYQNAEVDRLIEELRQDYDRSSQIEIAHRLHRQIAADQPYTFLYAPRGTVVVDRKIVMVERSESGEVRYEPLRPTPTGSIQYYFNRWKKLETVPDF